MESQNYVMVKKEFVQRKPVSWYRLTTEGRAAFTRRVTGLDGLRANLKTRPLRESN